MRIPERRGPYGPFQALAVLHATGMRGGCASQLEGQSGDAAALSPNRGTYLCGVHGLLFARDVGATDKDAGAGTDLALGTGTDESYADARRASADHRCPVAAAG